MDSTIGASESSTAGTLHSDLNRLEEVILSKVHQRTPIRMSEEVYLTKAFRYYDLSGTGWLDFDNFQRTLMPFAAGVADADLHMLFERYASNNAICYKKFVYEFVHGIQRQHQAVALEAPGMACETAQETVGRIKSALYGQGPGGIISLATTFQKVDLENTRSLSYNDFHATMHQFFRTSACPLHDEQINQIFQLVGQTYAVDQIAYDDFFFALTEELSPERRNSTRSAFRKLDSGCEGLVNIAHMVRSFNANRHPHVSDGSRIPDDVRNEFADTFTDFVAFRRGQHSLGTDLVAWEEFEDYYKFVSGCFETDDLFCSILQKVWDLDKIPNKAIDTRDSLARPAAGIPAKSRTGLHHWQPNTLPANPTHYNVDACVHIADIMLRTRQFIAKKGLRTAVDVVKNFYVADDDVDDMLDVYEFRHACQQSGLTFRDAEEASIFQACGVESPDGMQQGKIKLQRFFQLLHGALSPIRKSVVEQAFEALGGDPNDNRPAVSPATLKENFACEAHPSVARGELDPEMLLGEFLDTFSLLAHVLGGCQTGNVTFSDFLAYYQVVSSTIDNDALFDLLMRRLWSLPPTNSQDASNNPPDTPPRRPAVPIYGAPRSPIAGVASQKNDQKLSQIGMHHRYHRREDGAEVLPPSPPASNAKNSPVKKLSSVFGDSEGEGNLSAAICRLRESLARRGLKGWRSLVQRFEQYDYRKKGTVMRLDWEHLHKILGLGLSPEDRDIIFKGFSIGRRDGAMDYNACLRCARGSMSEKRKLLIQRLFESMKDDASGIVPATTLKMNFDAQNAPLCLLGRKNACEAAQEFCDAVDFFVIDGGFNIEAFAEFFSMISVIHDADDEFRLMTTAAFCASPAPLLGGC